MEGDDDGWISCLLIIVRLYFFQPADIIFSLFWFLKLPYVGYKTHLQFHKLCHGSHSLLVVSPFHTLLLDSTLSALKTCCLKLSRPKWRGHGFVTTIVWNWLDVTSLNTNNYKKLVISQNEVSCLSACNHSVFLLFVFQPVGFVTFDSRSGAEAAKNALNVSMALFLSTFSLWLFVVFPFIFSCLLLVNNLFL